MGKRLRGLDIINTTCPLNQTATAAISDSNPTAPTVYLHMEYVPYYLLAVIDMFKGMNASILISEIKSILQQLLRIVDHMRITR